MLETAVLSSYEYSQIIKKVQRDIYVDDCLSGGISDKTLQINDELQLISIKCGFSLKRNYIKWKRSRLSTDDKNINVDVLKWFSEEDMISLDIRKLNLVKEKSGKKPYNQIKVILKSIT